MVLEKLNPEQVGVVMAPDVPLLVLAGAGSGKTRVLTHRIAYLISELNINPWEIIAITFTNKAAGEMRERLGAMAGVLSRNMWIGTFHSTCSRILRAEGAALKSRDGHFAIYDSDDSKKVIKEILKRKNIPEKVISPGEVLSRISSYKNKLQGPDKARENQSGFKDETFAEIFEDYEKTLENSNAFDFDDLLKHCVELFTDNPDILTEYSSRFTHVFVDEYQDTNFAQYRFVSLLAEKNNKILVVGDDDQSIYSWRGADIRNILEFEKDFQNARVFRLERNYRSTEKILCCANCLISNNTGRKRKTLWTDIKGGEDVRVLRFSDDREEAEHIASVVGENGKYSGTAIFYRTNAQSRLLEERLRIRGVPYRIFGGLKFYERREIKDILAYMRVLQNPKDNISLSRIINTPKRGIGERSLNRVKAFAVDNGITLFDALRNIDSVPDLNSGTKRKINAFTDLLRKLGAEAKKRNVYDLVNFTVEETAYYSFLKTMGPEEESERKLNVEELLNGVWEFCEREQDNASLEKFLEEVSLVADIDNLEDARDYVSLMTVHSAKGLEFDNVFIAGMEDGLFPFEHVDFDEARLEEERRLFYVAITRAREKLNISYALGRMRRGTYQNTGESSFIREIGSEGVQLFNYCGGHPSQASAAVSRISFDDYRRTMEEVSETSAHIAHNDIMPSYEDFSQEAEFSLPELRTGLSVTHHVFGRGKILGLKGAGPDMKITVLFDAAGTKTLVARYAKLKKLA